MKSLTEKQQAVFNFLRDKVARAGVMPSTRDIQKHFRFASQTAAMNYLRALERQGVIKREPGKARAITLPSMQHRGNIVDIPIYGQIAAGMAGATEQEELGQLSIDAGAGGFSPKARTFALRVRGDSMIGAHIVDGDTVILEFREPRNGDVVAALIDGETTLKRYVVKNGKPFLRAENPDYPDLIPARELVVQGVMAALVRKAR